MRLNAFCFVYCPVKFDSNWSLAHNYLLFRTDDYSVQGGWVSGM